MIAPMQIASLGDKIARWTLVALVAAVPFAVVPASWATIVQSKLLLAAILVGLVVICYVIARIAQGIFVVPRDAIFYAAFLLPVAYLASAILSGATADSYASGLGVQDTVSSMTLLFATLALIAILFAGGLRNVTLVFLAFLAGCSAVLLFQIARLFAPSWLTLGGALPGSASSLFGSWHDLGTLAALMVFFAIALFNAPFFNKRISKIFLPLIGVLGFAVTFVVALPDIWYALFALLMLFSLYAWLTRGHEEVQARAAARRSIAAFVVGILALVSGFAGHYVYTHLPSPFQISQTEVRPSWTGTFEIGERVFSGSGSLFGTGPNNFQDAWGKWKPTGINETAFWSTDFNQGVGLVPTSFVTAGILGILAWLALAFAVAIHLVRFLRSERHGRALHAAIFGGILFLLAFHIIYTPTLAVSLSLFVLLGLSVALATIDHRGAFIVSLSISSTRGIASLIVFLALGVSVLLASVMIVRAALSDVMVQKAAADFGATGDLPRALSMVQLSLAINPDNDRGHRAAVELGLLQLQKLIAENNAADAAALREALSATIESGLTAVSIDSADYQNWLSLAGAYQNLATVGVEGAHENALAAYEKAAAANPTNPLPLLGAGQVALSQGDATSSVEYLNAAILLKSNLAVAYYLRSQGRGQMGDFSAAIDDAATAVSLAKEDPLGWYNLGTLLYSSADYENAAAALSQAVSLNNDYSNALFVLALAYNQLGNHERAIAAMERVVALNPDNETASSTLANLVAASSTPTRAAGAGSAQ